jgi:hypothetical protein
MMMSDETIAFCWQCGEDVSPRNSQDHTMCGIDCWFLDPSGAGDDATDLFLSLERAPSNIVLCDMNSNIVLFQESPSSFHSGEPLSFYELSTS